MILIWSSYRFGSTTMLKEIASKYNLQHTERTGELFGIVDHNKIKIDGPEIYKDFVIKIIPMQLHGHGHGKFIGHDVVQRFRDYASHEIWCLRDDMVASIKSAICAHEACGISSLDEWHTTGKHFDLSHIPQEQISESSMLSASITNFNYLKTQINSEDMEFDLNKKMVWLEDRIPLSESYNTFDLNTEVITDFCYNEFGTTSLKQYFKQ